MLTLTEGDARTYSIFELDILAQKARLRFIDGGKLLLIQRPMKDNVYKGFTKLGKPVATVTNLSQALPHLYTHAVTYLRGKESLRSGIREALESERAIV